MWVLSKTALKGTTFFSEFVRNDVNYKPYTALFE